MQTKAKLIKNGPTRMITVPSWWLRLNGLMDEEYINLTLDNNRITVEKV